MNLSEAMNEFDAVFINRSKLSKSLCSVDGSLARDVSLRSVDGKPLEEYYKWQLIYGLIHAGMYSAEMIGTEVYFPKGNIGSAPIKVDAVLFSNVSWIDHYREYRRTRNQDALHTVRSLAIGVIEFKRDGKKIESVFNSQIKSALKEPDTPFVIGAYYDERRLYLFKKVGDDIRRLDGPKNMPNSQRILERYQLEITDPYYLFPSHDALLKLNAGSDDSHQVAKKIEDLDVVYTVHDDRIKGALSRILRALDRLSMVDEEGYMILIQLVALKIYDEKQAEMHGSDIRFFINSDEHQFNTLADDGASSFVDRLKLLHTEASKYYRTILSSTRIDLTNPTHVRAAAEITHELQLFSFTRSRKSDLYQLVFYNFATAFKKEQNAQFLTPIPIIDFMVSIVNPRRNETVFDPCCGTADFLSVSYVNAHSKLDDRNLYGADNDRKMVLLSELNMLLNGDGNANIRHAPELGSLVQKFSSDGQMVKLNPKFHRGGEWDNWPDKTELLKFDVVLTNPPFGKGRNLDLNKASDRDAAAYYELYDRYVENGAQKDGLDLGVVFLENAVRSIKDGGRFAIVLSNSIASNKTWKFARDWLSEQVRIVALFDLPQDVFAETGVNTTIIVGYKPSSRRLANLISADYEVFTREISSVGYVKRTSNRNIVFDPLYKLDSLTFESVIDKDGAAQLDEDFSDVISDFREWCISQETELKRAFLD
jgi:type I restriction enzyme M protein